MKRSDQLVLGLVGLFAIGVIAAGAQTITNPQIAVPIGCAYNSSPPTLSDGAAGWVQCDSTGKLIVSGGGGGGGAVTIADGADVTEGAIADAAATAGSTGTISAKLRFLTGVLFATSTNQTVVQSPVAPAAATATKSVLVGAQATTAAVTPTNGQQSALSSDTNNNLLVSSGGAPNLATSQVSVATSDTSVAAARALRRSITVQQITGTQNVFCSQTTATTANGILLPAVVGASFTLNTTSAIRCIAVTGAQTVAVAETY